MITDVPVISPLRAPEPITTPAPHHPDQLQAFPTAVEATYGPLSMVFTVSLQRVPRQKCSVCDKRRVGLRIGLGELVVGPVMCGRCAGIR